MKLFVAIAIFLSVALCQPKPLKDLYMSTPTITAEAETIPETPELKSRFNPMTLNLIDQRFAQGRRQNSLNDISDELTKMRHQLYYRQDPVAPRQNPVLEPLLAGVVKTLKRAEKKVVKQADMPRAKEDMEMFTKLLDSVKSINGRLDPKPKSFTKNEQALRNNQIQKLLYIPQPQEETEEQQAAHTRSRSQSQMLHRLTHVIDRLGRNSQADMDRKVKYDRYLNEIMHSHLHDPRYHDGLHDHLMAHHLSTPHSDDEFQEHIAQHVLYHDVGRNAESEFLRSPPTATPATAPLPATQQMYNARVAPPQDDGLIRAQKSALATNHMLGVAEQREQARRNSMNSFAEQSYDKFKTFKPI